MKLWIAIAAIGTLGSCNMKKKDVPSVDIFAEQQALMNADISFSNKSMAEGMKQAYLEYIDSNGVLLRPGHMPIIGADAIDYLIQFNDTSYKLNWKPAHAEVSRSADLGYTYGLYALHPTNQDTTLYGTYVNIWKKQQDGSWKFVLGSANEGVDEE